MEVGCVRGACLAREPFARDVGRGRESVFRIWARREEAFRGVSREVPFVNHSTIDNGDANGSAWAGLNTGGCFTDRQSIGAHVALAHDAKPIGVMRHFVGAFKNAILATDALVIEMPDNSGEGIFFVSEHRAAVQAGWVDAMMASSGDRLLIRQCSFVADQLAN